MKGAAGITDWAIVFMAEHMFCVDAGGKSGRLGNMPKGGREPIIELEVVGAVASGAVTALRFGGTTTELAITEGAGATDNDV